MMLNRLLILLIGIVFVGCNHECRKVTESYDDGKENVVLTYPDCSDTSYFKRQYFHSNGQILSEGYYENGLKAGEWKTWTEFGVITAHWFLIKGKEEGQLNCWYDNGEKKKELNFVDGLKHGNYKIYDVEGKIQIVGIYEKGKAHGTFTDYKIDGGWHVSEYVNDSRNGAIYEHNIDEDGDVGIVIGQYKNNLEVGMWEFYDKDSTLSTSLPYEDGELIGVGVSYYKNGDTSLICYYSEGNSMIIKKGFDNKGKVTLENGKGTIIKYYDDGTKKSESVFLNSVQNGNSTHYYNDGKIETSAIYTDDKANGITDWYYPNGKLALSILYKNDLKMEVLKSFDKYGKGRDLGILKNGNGDCEIYNDDGSLKEIREYKDGVKIENEN